MSGVRVRVVGGYQLGSCLGSGGSGTVYRALAPSGQEVALKLLHPHVANDPVARERLRREALITQIDARSIAGVLDFEVDGHEPFIVSRLVEGPTLAQFVDGAGPLNPVELANLAEDLAAGLHLVHAAGAVHRDVTPRNVIMSASGPVLIDFGISQWVGSERVTGVGLVIGTAGYFPPEYWRGNAQEMTPAFDWWGWAGLLAFAATGRPPFGTGNPVAILERAERGEVDLEGIDEGLAAVLRGALWPDPAGRTHPTQTLQGLADLADAASSPTEVMPPCTPTWVEDAANMADGVAHPGENEANTTILGQFPIGEEAATAVLGAGTEESMPDSVRTSVLGVEHCGPVSAGDQVSTAVFGAPPGALTPRDGQAQVDDVGHQRRSEYWPHLSQEKVRDGLTAAMETLPERYGNVVPTAQVLAAGGGANPTHVSAYWQPTVPTPPGGAPYPAGGAPTPGFPLGVPTKAAMLQGLAQPLPQPSSFQEAAALQGPPTPFAPALAPAWARALFAISVGAVLAVMSLGRLSGHAGVATAGLVLFTAVVGESASRQQSWWRTLLSIPLYFLRQALMLAPLGVGMWLVWRGVDWLAGAGHLATFQPQEIGASGVQGALVLIGGLLLWHTPLAHYSRIGTGAILAELPRKAVVAVCLLLFALAVFALLQTSMTA